MTYTLAIVDDGLLDLTNFKTPDPWNDFYSREALGIRTWEMCIRDSVVGTAIAIKKGCTNAAEAAEAIGIGLQAFCIPGSVADDRKVRCV